MIHLNRLRMMVDNMDLLLTDDELRVLGCLIEKEMATPDYYPLTLNALINACNQKSNRNPVVSFDEDTVRYSLNGLQENNLMRQSNLSRVAKYEQIFSDTLKLLPREKAALCILMLRGPQTAGEIRSRSERLYSFKNLDEVQETLTVLEEAKLVRKLARQAGRKESRYVQLLNGDVDETAVEATTRREPDTIIVRKERDNRVELQEQVDSLRSELQELRRGFEKFKSQFE